MIKTTSDKLDLLYGTVPALLKHQKSFNWLYKSNEAKCLKLGNAYRNNGSAQVFGKTIAEVEKNKAAIEIKQVQFVTLTSDWPMDSSITEQDSDS